MEIILTVLITLLVVSLIGSVWGVIRLNGRVYDLGVARMDIDDQLLNLRDDLENDIEHLHTSLPSLFCFVSTILDLYLETQLRFF